MAVFYKNMDERFQKWGRGRNGRGPQAQIAKGLQDEALKLTW